jgi:lipopolysaccharide biosynthesis regulator YciM
VTLPWWLVIILATSLIYVMILLSFEKRRSAVRNPAREHYYAGLRALLAGEEELAFKRLRDSVREDSQNVDAYLRIGELLRRRGQAQKAMAIHMDLAQRAGLSPEDAAAVRKALAQDQLSMGSRDEARRLLLELCKHSSTEAWAVSRLHRLLLEEGKFEEAYKRRQEMARMGEPLDPKTAAVYLTMAGLAASDAGEHRRGRVLVRDALKLDPPSPAAHYALGEIYERDGRLEDAVRAFKSFLEHSPELAGLVFPHLEKVLFEMGQYSEIAGIYRQVLTRHPGHTDALLGLARFSEKKGDHQAALSHLNHILETDPGHLVARQLLVQIHKDAGQPELAWQAAQGFFTWLPGLKREFECTHCREQSKSPRWFCPACFRFRTYELGPSAKPARAAVEHA